jgi:transposase-like protein
MTAPKLSDLEKQQILDRYRQTSETSSTLASRYGVSTSTISRVLKNGLPADEYEILIQQKRAARLSEDAQPVDASEPSGEIAAEVVSSERVAPQEVALEANEDVDVSIAGSVSESEADAAVANRKGESFSSAAGGAISSPKPKATSAPVLRRRSNSPTGGETAVEGSQLSLPKLFGGEEQAADAADTFRDGAEESGTQVTDEVLLNPTEAAAFQDLLDEDLLDSDDDDDDDLDDELDEGLEEDDDDLDEDQDPSDPVLLVSSRLQDGSVIQVLPFAEAPIPRTCYLVVDRAAELITRPLKEFGDLGQIPDAETLEKTLPVFDNHRVAKRYSNPRTQRVIKLPDGRILQKASSHLRAKGIMLLLIDGRVYSLKE